MPAVRLLPVSLDAVLVELDDLPQTLALLASLQAAPLAGIDELVPGARTLLIRHRPAVLPQALLAQRLAQRLGERSGDRPDGEAPGSAPAPATGPASAGGARPVADTVEIPVHYDGEDLAEVAALVGLTPEEVVRRHTGSLYTVAFTGFAPGFAYLSGGDASLQVPRRASPRTRIPAGAVALAGPFSGVYPQASPGGWQLIGRTATRMWDLSRPRPALLQPGQRVRFVDAGPAASAEIPAELTAGIGAEDQADASATAALVPRDLASRPEERHDERSAPTALEVLHPGLQALFQDLGRAGQAGQGVSASGAMDRASLRAANRLVGNPSDAAAIESVQGGLALRCLGDAVVAVTGADGPLTLRTADGRAWPLPRGRPLALADGDTLELGEPRTGLRSYLAARGGFVVTPVLGSCATDTLARLGPPALAAGDRLVLGPGQGVVGDAAAADAVPALPAPGDEVTLDVVMGPRTDWFTPAAVERLAAQRWQVTPQSSRVGLRLAGVQPLARANAFDGAELPSEGTVRGALQVPPSGQPVLFMADHPLTGGYPVIATVAPHHLDLAGQLPIGAWVRLRPLAPFAAIALSAGPQSHATPHPPPTPTLTGRP